MTADGAVPEATLLRMPTQTKQLYDKVLVDAECTHDGSIKHLAKFEQWGWETFEAKFLRAERVDELHRLQLQLVHAGFKLLRPGGHLVYSTCSFARGQNEDVVAAFLQAEPTATLVPVESLHHAPCRAGSLPHTLRFDPRTSQTSGLFVAKLRKGGAGAGGSTAQAKCSTDCDDSGTT